MISFDEIKRQVEQFSANLSLVEHVTVSEPDWLKCYELATHPSTDTTIERLWGVPVHTSEHIPRGMGIIQEECRCSFTERMEPNHLIEHMKILDFRTDEQRAADAEKYRGNSEAA